MFIEHAHLLIAAAILVVLAIICVTYSFNAGVKAKAAIEAEKLDFARRSGTHIVIRRKGFPLQKVYLLSQVQLDNIRKEALEIRSYIAPDMGEEHY